MEKQPKICAFASNFDEPKKRKRPDSRQVKSSTDVSTGLLPLFSEHPGWVKKLKLCKTTCSIDYSRSATRRVPEELKLFDESSVCKRTNSDGDGSRRNRDSSEDMERRVATNIKRMRSAFNLRNLEEEIALGLSSQLSLYHDDPFKIKKKMKPSDLGNLCRLLLSTELVVNHVLPFLTFDQKKEVEVYGLKVWISDMDTNSTHQLVLKRWSTSKSYIFNEGWTKYFVKRRNLAEGDVIGMYWDTPYSRLNFSVLSRAAAAAAAD